MTSSRPESAYATATIPSLDGIRAIAVSLVFFAHSGFQDLVPGGLGVTLFFVLSGYLITTLMRLEYARDGRINYANFYVRRLLRLMPPLFVVVALSGVLAHAKLISGGFTVGGLLSSLFYVGNYFVIAHDFNGLPAGIGVIWSLAIEEHYYVFYPPLAAVLLRIGRVGLSVAWMVGLCALILAWRCWLVAHGASEEYLTMATDTRIDAILVGCLLGLACNPWLDSRAAPRPIVDWTVAATCLVVLLGTLLYRDETFRLTARYTLQSAALAGLLYLAVARSGDRPFRWLSSKPLVYIGTVSYTIYLAHDVVLTALEAHWPQLGWAATTAIGAIATLAIAEPMRRWVERPCARLRKRLHRATPDAPVAIPAVMQ